MINWEFLIVNLVICFIMAAIWELVESLIKGDGNDNR